MAITFYAVTASGAVYEASTENGQPTVTKIFQHGYSKVTIGTTLKDGTHIGISWDGGIMMYFPEKKGDRMLSPDETNIAFLGGHSSPIVALLSSSNEKDSLVNWETGLEEWSQALWSQTEETLRMILDSRDPFVLVDKQILVLFGFVAV